MPYETLHDVTGVGKIVTIRNKFNRLPFTVGVVRDEVSVSDGEQKYFIQFIDLADVVACDADPTRYVLRVGYYTKRTDGWFCLGSQFAPIFTPTEFCRLIEAVTEKGWLEADGVNQYPPVEQPSKKGDLTALDPSVSALSWGA